MFTGYDIGDYQSWAEEWATQFQAALNNPDYYQKETGVSFDEHCDDILVSFISDCCERGEDIAVRMHPTPKFSNDYSRLIIHDAVRYGHNMWEAAISKCDALSESAFLVNMEAIAMDMSNSQDSSKIIGELLSEELTKAVVELGDKLFEDEIALDPTACEIPKQEDIQKALEHCDENLMKEFFETFKELKTFKADMSQYETDRERELHTKLMALYQEIMKQNGNPQ